MRCYALCIASTCVFKCVCVSIHSRDNAFTKADTNTFMLSEYTQVCGSYASCLRDLSWFLDFMSMAVYMLVSVAARGRISSLFLNDDSLIIG